ncbi:uncharacterized protein VP01_519g5 [Puccinia sorghi]|uniref:DUF7143 domain-containing protein n=1 Tax=Puccinia sorghi TaxID=27349 RepID=A0A0L6UKP8_9BASI|nr:uncharacterized protein VP01_519g5 [Puccinia sorghi]
MFKISFCILLTLLAAQLATAIPLPHKEEGRHHAHDRPCFMTGTSEIPKDVVTDMKVICLPGRQPFKGVPDVQIANTVYSVQDFQREPSLSPVGFALKYFTPKTRSDEVTLALENLMDVYGATNAGLRSWGQEKHLEVKKIKGPSFYLAFQHAISVGDMKAATHQLGKVLKNCFNCTPQDKQQVVDIAVANHVELPGCI